MAWIQYDPHLDPQSPFEVAGGDDGVQGAFCPCAPFQQPVREGRSGEQFRDGGVHGADAGVAVAVAIVDVGAGGGGGGVFGAADLVGLGRKDRT